MNPKESLDRYYYVLSLLELRMINDGRDLKASYGDILFMNLIMFTEDCTSSKLAEMLNITKSAVTARVNGLVEQGLVEKTRSGRDGRVYYLTLSEKAKAVYNEEDSVISDAVRRITERHGPEEMAKFCEILDSASDIIEGMFE